MRALLGEALEVGGLGFSTTQSFTHSDGVGCSRCRRGGPPPTSCSPCATRSASTRAPRSSGSPTAASAASTTREIDLMIDMSLRGQRPINWNVLTVDSAVPERSAGQLEASAEAERRGARVVALTMPTHRRHEHELPHLLRAQPAARLGRDPVAAGRRAHGEAGRHRDPHPHGEPGRRARGRRVRPAHRLGSLPHRRHVQRRPTRGSRAASSPTSPASAACASSSPCSTSCWPTTCAPCCGPGRPTTTPRAGACGSTPGARATPCSAAPTPAPTSTACAARRTRPSSSATACGASSSSGSRRPCTT